MVRIFISLLIITTLTVAGYFLFSYLITAVFDIEQTIETKKELVEQEKQNQAETSILEELKGIFTRRGEIPAEEGTQTLGVSLTKDDEVIAPSGVVAQNDAEPLSPSAPQQTAPLTRGDIELPGETIELTITEQGIAPKEIQARRGELITLIVSSGDQFAHVFKFVDPSLRGVAVGLGAFETRAISFNAPATKGEYAFFCDVPGHEARGERGVMTVR